MNKVFPRLGSHTAILWGQSNKEHQPIRFVGKTELVILLRSTYSTSIEEI